MSIAKLPQIIQHSQYTIFGTIHFLLRYFNAQLSSSPRAGRHIFFTVNLLERRSHLLVECVDDLREAVRTVRRNQPFHVDAEGFT